MYWGISTFLHTFLLIFTTSTFFCVNFPPPWGPREGVERKEREGPRNKQNMCCGSEKSGNAHWMFFVLPRPFGLTWLHPAQVSFNPLSPSTPCGFTISILFRF